MAEVSLSMAASPAALDLVHTELERLWQREPGVAPADRLGFETGLIEVLGNVVEHAFGSEPVAPDDRLVTVDIDVSTDRLLAVVGDNGRPADVDLSGVTLPPTEAETGRGLAMALASLDEVRHERRGGCNHWTLVRRREATSGS